MPMLKLNNQLEWGAFVTATDRIIDSNFNRLAEGLRVLEDVARMVLNDRCLTQELRTLRHNSIRAELPFNLTMLNARDSVNDVGEDLSVEGEKPERDLPSLIIANSRRAQESLRVLEELARLPEYSGSLDSSGFKSSRFKLYTLEQKLISKVLRRDKADKIRGLYVILDTDVLKGRDPLEAAARVIAAGVKVIQLKDKKLDKRSLIGLAIQLQSLCSRNRVLFIVNDFLDIALAAGSDGLHLGQDDIPPEVARSLLPQDKILGCSAYTPEAARAAENAGADYIAVGSIFSTSSKDNIEVVGLERIRQVKDATKLPVVAIGGITANNAEEVCRAGSACLCVISSVLNSSDITSAARSIIDIIEAAK
jgi:thiamine-phosphate pyrophosphorylase